MALSGCSLLPPGLGIGAHEPTYVMPDVDAVRSYDGYEMRPCGLRPAPTGSLFTSGDITGRPGALDYVATRVVEGATVDVTDGRLLFVGGEYLPHPESAGLAVPAGNHRLDLLLADVAGSSDEEPSGEVVAVGVRLRQTTPVRWEEKLDAGFETDGGTGGVAGAEAAAALAKVRGMRDFFGELREPEYWTSPCQVYARSDRPDDGTVDAVQIAFGWDGGYPGAVGYDAAGAPAAVMVTAAILPWSLLGLPGTPPPEAAMMEPTG